MFGLLILLREMQIFQFLGGANGVVQHTTVKVAEHDPSMAGYGAMSPMGAGC